MTLLSNIDPVALYVGPLKVHWYALAYLFSIVSSWGYVRLIVAYQINPGLSVSQADDFLLWLMCGVLLGGRLGYVVFYDIARYLDDPVQILMTWRGGMSFHGGLLGVIIATTLFCMRRNLNLFILSDFLSLTAPFGLFLGRIANFINGELYGRVTDVSWAIIFPKGGALARHPSQIYEAVLEGLVPLVLLNFLYWKTPISHTPGRLAGLFLLIYCCARIVCECVRQPDPGIGFFFGFMTMGQILSFPMFGVGIWLVMRRSVYDTQAKNN